MIKITNSEFIKKASYKHNGKYCYKKSIYKTSREKVVITCKKHGDFEQKANNHLNGVGCPKCKVDKVRSCHLLTQDEVILRANKIHNNKYDYSKLLYLNNRKKVVIICPKHGEFNQNIDSHLLGSGCPLCANILIGKKNTLSNEEFINRCNIVHNNIYNYSKCCYKNNKDKVNIICSIHGNFQQQAQNHLNGSGCPLCSIENKGWKYSKWKDQAEKSKNFVEYKVYIIKCWNSEEEFYKIGKTFRNLKLRFNKSFPYKFKIINIFIGDCKEISLLETKLKNLNSKNKYKPMIKFNGMQECFKKIIYE